MDCLKCMKEIYLEINSVWSEYTDTYSKPSSAESYALLNRAIIKIVENGNCDQEIKRIIEE